MESRAIVVAFCEECAWARAVRTHFQQLFESGQARHRLLAESAKGFFQDLNLILIEYVLLQQCKLTDPASSGGGKDNLTSNFLLTLRWSAKTERALGASNEKLMRFRAKVLDARRKLVAHLDLKARLQPMSLGAFGEDEEREFWSALQDFANAAHSEAVGSPFDIDAIMPEGDVGSLLHCLSEAADYNDLVAADSGFLMRRLTTKRYRNI